MWNACNINRRWCSMQVKTVVRDIKYPFHCSALWKNWITNQTSTKSNDLKTNLIQNAFSWEKREWRCTTSGGAWITFYPRRFFWEKFRSFDVLYICISTAGTAYTESWIIKMLMNFKPTKNIHHMYQHTLKYPIQFKYPTKNSMQ